MNVVEFGAGTGRLTRMLAQVAKNIRAYDSSQHMLDVAIAKLKKTGLQNWQVDVGDHRKIAAEDEAADVAISAWSMCYLVIGNDETWQMELSKGLGEMQRLVRNGGALIIIETLGTGHETPQPPAVLEAYYAFLEAKGFQRTWIRTDYLFRDAVEAKMLISFFFGNEMVEKFTSDERARAFAGVYRHLVAKTNTGFVLTRPHIHKKLTPRQIISFSASTPH